MSREGLFYITSKLRNSRKEIEIINYVMFSKVGVPNKFLLVKTRTIDTLIKHLLLIY